MEPVIIITGYCAIVCAAASLYKAIEQVVIRNPGKSGYFLSLLLLSISYLQVSLGLFLAGILNAMPMPLFLGGLCVFILAAYLAGPLAFLYYSSLIGVRIGRSVFHLAPAIPVMFAAILFVYTRDSGYHLVMRRDFFFTNHEIPVYLFMAGAALSIVIYTFRILAIELSVRRNDSIRYALRWLITITAGLLLSPVLLYVGFIRQWIAIAAAGTLFLVVNNMLFILAQARYQDFFLALGRAVQLSRRRTSILKGLDIALLQEKLDRLMGDEKYYQNFDISIKSLADALEVTPHQLSCYLNKKLRLDFRKFINGYRVEEARKLLLNNIDQNVLNIGFQVGFGSKTSFNVTFKEFTGKSPREYRDDYLKDRR